MRTAAIVALLMLCGGCAKTLEAQAVKHYGARASQAVAEYERARLSGDFLGMCVKARLVAAAYGDAQQPATAEAWRAREREDCNQALDAMGVEARAGE